MSRKPEVSINAPKKTPSRTRTSLTPKPSTSRGAIPKVPPTPARGAASRTPAAASRGAVPKTPEPTSKGAIPKLPRCPAAAVGAKKELKEQLEANPPKAYENPAFSIPLKKAYTNPLLAEKDAKKTIRRNKPPGEDLAELKKIHGSLREQGGEITVAEYVALVAPSTGDNGDLMRKVLMDEMNSFRKLARKVYETMTQDVSDVLTNQHIQLKEYEQERIALYTQKMMRAINEIYSYAPKFDFERYFANPKNYLNLLFPIPKKVEADSDEAEQHRRQQAFHRLNWLKMEGERLSAENKRLQARLRDLKNEQREEMLAAEARENQVEAQREQLQAEEEAMQQQLDQLTDKVEETIIDTEAAIRIAQDEANLKAPTRKKSSTAKVGGGAGAGTTQRRRKRPDWTADVAVDIEEHAIEENVMAEAEQSSALTGTVAGAIKKVREKTTRKKVEKGSFHFSPIKTPPPKPPKERSPFHFSPIKSPPPRVPSPEKVTSPPPLLHTTRMRKEKLTVNERLFSDTEEMAGASAAFEAAPEPPPELEEAAAASFEVARPPPARRGRQYAPKDSWGGFY